MKLQPSQTVKEQNVLPKTYQNAIENKGTGKTPNSVEVIKREDKPVYQTYIYRSYGGGYQGL